MKKMSMKNLVLAAGAITLLGLATSPAKAGVFTEVNLLDGSGTTLASNINELDWVSNSAGAALGVGPFGTPLSVGQTFDFVYQSRLVGASDLASNSVPFAATLNSGGAGGALAGNEYQITIVARFNEIVTGFGSSPNTQSAVFELGPGGGTISIYYDAVGVGGGGTEANVIAGTGFDDGTEIARFTVISQVSAFTAITGGPLGGSGTGSATLLSELVAVTDFVLDDYILGLLAPVFDLEFGATLNFPVNPPASGTTAFHVGGSAFYPGTAVGGNDLLLQVDGFNTFTAQVPEPRALLLLALGLVVLGFAARRSRPTA
jgi:hypothetical protein